MFGIAFVLASISYLYLAVGYHKESETILLQNLYYCAGLPLLIAVFIAVHESFLKIEGFDRIFKIFLVISVLFLLPIFLPFSIGRISSFFRVFLAFEVIIVSSYLFFIRRESSGLMFVLSLICFTVAGMAQARNLEYLSIFSYFMAHIFLVLVFSTAIPSKDQHTIASYFSLKKELVTTKKKLSESEERFKKIVENINDVVMLTEPDGTISYLSPSCEKVLGWPPEDLIGRQPWIVHPDDLEKVKKIHHDALKGVEGQNFEYRIKTKTGETRWVSHSWSAMLSNGKIHSVVSIVRDVTRQKMVLEELKDAHELLFTVNKDLERKVKERTAQIQHLVKQKDEFINQLGHDLKTPLTPMMTLLPILKEQAQTEKDKELFDIVIRNVHYMKELVTKTIELAKLNSDKITLKMEDINLFNEVNTIINNNKILFEKNNITVENKIQEDLIVKADKLLLTELLNNLITNAIKYMPQEGGNITINAQKEGDLVTVSVQDTGIGMTKEQIDRVFDEFYKADESRHDLDSSGLGLSIAKRIVETHGGRIWAESSGLGNGTTIFFTLPASSCIVDKLINENISINQSSAE